MTGLGVERTPRTAYPLPSGPPVGVSTPLPPHIQGAERRSERRARHTGTRWGLRVLVVGGLAGAAWLLTGVAAQAADRVDEPEGSLLGSLMGADTAPVTDLLQAAAQPLENTWPAHHRRHVVADILDVPRQVLHRPVRTFDEDFDDPTGTTVDVLTVVDEVPGEVAAPPRLTGGTAPDQRLDDAAGPNHERPHRAVAEPADTPVPLEEPGEKTAEPSRTGIARTPNVPVAGHRAVVPVKHRVRSAPSAHRHHETAPAVGAGPATVRVDSTPGGDGPAAPLRLHLGDVSGTSTTVSGTPMEGGSAAFRPAAIVNSTMARHRPAIASDVEARRHDAEAPTASPD